MRKFFQNIIRARNSLLDSSYNRKLVGYDRQGNSYYQYYNEEGKESKREVESSTMHNVLDVEFDPHWDEWLRGKKKEAWTKSELENLWNSEDSRVEVGLNYEKKDADMMRDFRNSTNWRGQGQQQTQYQNPAKAYKDFDQKTHIDNQNKNVNKDGNPYANVQPDMTGFSSQINKKKQDDYGFAEDQHNQKWTKGTTGANVGQENFEAQSWNPKSKRK